jgi:hypothetical protein
MPADSSARSSLRDVVRVTQSPMNAKRWCLDLSCRHEVWVTSSRQPKRSRVHCVECSK